MIAFKWTILMVSTSSLVVNCGCLMTVSASSVQTGTLVPEQMTRDIVVGETTRDELVEQLGDPSSIETLDDGTEVLAYESVLNEKASFGLLIVISVSSKKTRTSLVKFHVRDGVVVDYSRQKSVSQEW
jgi:hypothetical protein